MAPVCEILMPDSITSDADLWASCIGGAKQGNEYTVLIEAAGFEGVEVGENPQYEFISDQAAIAC